ncbi:hypothetical protein [Shouchella patagoniensis]|uniref:hypothetical protein n=1 Tax=Shouchella patagoniensis TaxID=228576 RepID=UPI000994D2FB|nr:hypothetical protein [Shouchella patagoniensis]
MSFIKLLHFEMKRIWKAYVLLVLLVTVMQLVSIWIASRNRVANLEASAKQQGLTLDQLGRDYSFDGAELFNSLPIIGSIMLSIAVLLIYMLLIWYRDWFGKNTVIYRLLMLPTNRASLYFAKLITIFSLVLGLLSLQILLIIAGVSIATSIIPTNFFYHSLSVTSVIQYGGPFSIFLPSTPLFFVLVYGLGFTFLSVVFTAILLERSFRIKGLVFGAMYLAFIFTVFISILEMSSTYFFFSETLLVIAATGVIILVLSIWLSIYFLQKKVTV